MKRGKFIVIDGIDGSGKGSIAKMLAQYIFEKSKANHVFLTREPYHSQYLAEIRQILKQSTDPKANAEKLAELFVNDRKEHIKIIEKILANGDHVISDRYKHSTLVFQSTQGVPMAKLIEMHEGLLIPDLTIILDVSGEMAITRIEHDKGRTHKEMFEQKEFLEKLRQGYLELPKILTGEKIIIVDSSRPLEWVFEDVKKEVNKLF